MGRNKLIEIIDSNGRFNLPTVELECLADHLIANGIGDITAEKHRADIAEEALSKVKETAMNILHRRACDVDILLNRAIKAGVKVDDLLYSPKCNHLEKYEKDLQQAEHYGKE